MTGIANTQGTIAFVTHHLIKSGDRRRARPLPAVTGCPRARISKRLVVLLGNIQGRKRWQISVTEIPSGTAALRVPRPSIHPLSTFPVTRFGLRRPYRIKDGNEGATLAIF